MFYLLFLLDLIDLTPFTLSVVGEPITITLEGEVFLETLKAVDYMWGADDIA